MTDNTMKAIRIHDYGGPEALTFEDAPRPELQAGHVLVRLAAAGVNPSDSMSRAGAFKQYMPLAFPWTPGLEGAGVVESVGEGVTSFKAGQEVYGFVIGGYAQYALAEVSNLQPKPPALTMEEAAASPMGAAMAWAAVIDTAQIEEGQAVLIHGAAGGIGAFATQLAHWKKAFVIGTASADNLAFVRSLGADMASDYYDTPFEAVVHNVDAVIDTVGGDIPARSWAVLRPGGILAAVAGRLEPEAGKAQGLRSATVVRPAFGGLKQISELLEAKTVVPTIRKVFALEEARQAHELSETRHGRGRIVLKIP
jgi:NADPH:quinone reductase-like Zn-dependent oxidoreductase